MAIFPWEFLNQSSWFPLNEGLLHSPFVLWLLIPLFILGFLKFKQPTHRNSPPSPPKLPIIGNLHQLGTLPHRSLRSLSDKYGPLMLLKLGQVPTLVISSAEIVEEIVKNHDIAISDRPSMTAAKIMLYGGSDFIMSPYGEYWRRARKICVLELLTQKRVQSFRFIREEEVASLINKLRHESCSGRSVNLSQLLLETSYGIASRCIIGKKAKEDGNFGELAKRFLRSFAGFSFGDLFPYLGWLDALTGHIGRMKAAFKETDAFLDSVIEEKIKSPENNMLDLDDDHGKKDIVQILLHLLHNDHDSKLTINNVKAILLDMFMAGTETSATTTEWIMAELLKNPRVMKRVQEEVRRVANDKGRVEEDDISKMEYLKCIIKETLRLHPAGPLLLPRETSARIELQGYDIMPKTRVLTNAWAIQRDPKVWKNPENFVPERFEDNAVDFRGSNFELIPFGAGRRGCPGISFGVAAVESVIANLLYWFDWKLRDDVDCESLDMTETFSLSASRKMPLHVVPNAYGC
ncbi:cytochrome P450, family 71, subfamily B, polypeptide 13 [Hibiscus trionum]|uniref:Cytochrome P450, family 71, subfamily B, polypeptide 13 n=1 Tax=Hibiscus trionum TaxID=183268 RepID=A0A9W7IZV6_HIBTR|nr:cytochrome P450, family 71, subfamily B, polypeptide 13 [Hibiscus trionum]